MSSVLALIVASLVQWVPTSWACDCSFWGDHVQTMELFQERQKKHARGFVIADVELISRQGHGGTFSVKQVLQGSESRKEIQVWGDPGHLCRAPIGRFKAGSRWLMLLEKNEMPYDAEGVDDYTISGCGVYALEIQNVNGVDTLSGNLAEGVSSLPLSEYLTWLDQSLKVRDLTSQIIQKAVSTYEFSCDLTIALSGPQGYDILSETEGHEFKLDQAQPMSILVLGLPADLATAHPDIPQDVLAELNRVAASLRLFYSPNERQEYRSSPLRHLKFHLLAGFNGTTFGSEHRMTVDILDRQILQYDYLSGRLVVPLKTHGYQLIYKFRLK